MTTETELRHKARMLKADNFINYKDMAEAIDIKDTSFYAWNRGRYNLSQEKQIALDEFIDVSREA